MSNGRKASPKSINASKRDAIWLDKIAKQQDAKALSYLFEVYGPKLKGWLMARGVGNATAEDIVQDVMIKVCLLYTSPSPRDATLSRMPSSA